jgi:hypothetical protein
MTEATDHIIMPSMTDATDHSMMWIAPRVEVQTVDSDE